MPQNRSTRASSLMLALRKVFVSGFVIFSFVAYALHDRSATPDSTARRVDVPTEDGQAHLMSESPQTLPTVKPSVPTSQFLAPTSESSPQSATPAPTDKPQGGYVDGVYTGPTVNAFYGLVQVEATIQDGWLSDIQFLSYPDDRRTSRRINAVAMPRLTQEAIQVQSARVHIVSGATLTSEAFARSLYGVLSQVGKPS